jgi:uncharacterized protein YaaQ
MFKRLIATLALALVPLIASAMWVTGGIKTNPTTNTILADTGAIGGGGSTYTFVVAASAAVRIEIAVRDASNSVDVVVQNLFVPANGNLYVVMPVDVPPGGRIVMRNPVALTGSVQASILKDGAA